MNHQISLCGFALLLVVAALVCSQPILIADTVLEAIDTGARVYVINLKRREDRMNFMSAQLSLLSIPFQRFPAVAINNGTILGERELHNQTRMNISLIRENLFFYSKKKYYSIFASWGAVGCWQSLLQILGHPFQ